MYVPGSGSLVSAIKGHGGTAAGLVPSYSQRESSAAAKYVTHFVNTKGDFCE